MSRNSFIFPGIITVITSYVILLSGCTENEQQNPAPEHLVSSQILFKRSIDEILSFYDLAGLGDLDKFLKYDINIYKITYNTEYLGKEISASGLVTFPVTIKNVPMLSFQHGTMTKHSDAPTEDLTAYGFLSSIASAGYIMLIPDFIGFGNSSDFLHPYYHSFSTVTAITDMLKASSELALQKDCHFNGKVFLAGYSEGGYATMAVHKSIEENPLEGFQLVASAPASGGYDLKGMQDYFFSLTEYDDPCYLAFLALSYKNTYGFDQILNDIFQEPFASGIPGFFDGDLSIDEINNNLTTIIPDLIQPDILSNINTDEKFSYIINALEENSLSDWMPVTRMFMYHGTADITVPYQNSVDTYENMISLGASSDIVTLTPLEGKNHSTGTFSYFSEFIKAFDKLK